MLLSIVGAMITAICVNRLSSGLEPGLVAWSVAPYLITLLSVSVVHKNHHATVLLGAALVVLVLGLVVYVGSVVNPSSLVDFAITATPIAQLVVTLAALALVIADRGG